jgi:alanine racemase
VISLNTSAEINLSALSHNLRAVKNKAKTRTILAVVKAQAYGHGAVRVSRHLLRNGVSMLGVAFTREAIALRDAGIKAPIVVFFERGKAETYLRYSLTPVIYDLKNARTLSLKARTYNRILPVHIKVDTGMGRIGLRIENARQEILKIAGLRNLKLEGLMSHLADADMTDREFATAQAKRFKDLISTLKTENIHFNYHHIANSAAVLRLPKVHFDMVRPGIMLYGYGPARKNMLRPVLSLKSRVMYIKKVPPGTPISYGRTFTTKRTSTIATIPIGYGDGYNRKLSNRGQVLINGKRAPVVGRVCMDTILVDVTEIPGVKENAEVVLIGQQGEEEISAKDIADMIDTIPYEVLTSIGERVKRTYSHTP